MKAITYTHYGAPDVLHVEEVGRPTPAADELLVRVRAVEVTKSDCELRSFRFPVKWFWLPLRIALGVRKPKRQILGGYFAGEVVALGHDVDQFAVGDAVFGATNLDLGAYGELMTLPASYTIALKPNNMSFVEAAAVPLGALNALHFMKRAQIQPGEAVLINGAGGSIGGHAVQIAKSMGAEVTAVDSGLKRDLLLELGADHFIDYTRTHFSAGGRTYDVLFDMVAGSSYSACMEALNAGGRYLTGNPRLSDMLRTVMTNRLTAKRATFAFARETKEELEEVRHLVEQGTIRPFVDRVYTMEEAAEAHRRVESEQRIGTIVIAMPESVT